MVIFTPRTEQFSAIWAYINIFSLLNWNQTNFTHRTCWFHCQIEHVYQIRTLAWILNQNILWKEPTSYLVLCFLGRVLTAVNVPFLANSTATVRGRKTCLSFTTKSTSWSEWSVLKWRVSKRNPFHKYTGTFLFLVNFIYSLISLTPNLRDHIPAILTRNYTSNDWECTSFCKTNTAVLSEFPPYLHNTFRSMLC